MTGLQTEIGRWCRERFGANPSGMGDVAAIGEEAGEVLRAVNKRGHGQRGGTYASWSRNLRDECADVALTLYSFAENVGCDLDAQTVLMRQERFDMPSADRFLAALTMFARAGELADLVVRQATDVTLQRFDLNAVAAGRLMLSLYDIAAVEYFDLDAVILERWVEVRERPTGPRPGDAAKTG